MQERAKNIDANLTIESEIAEGTRVELIWKSLMSMNEYIHFFKHCASLQDSADLFL